MNSLQLAFRLLRRDWRAGELRVFLFAVVTTVMCLSSIGLFTDRMTRAVETQNAILLGGDLIVASDTPINPEWRRKAAELHLKDSLTLSFLSMVTANDKFQLTAVKAVDQNYPLLGELKISSTPFGDGQEVKHGPPPNTVWIAPRFGIQTTDALKIGDAQFTKHAYLQFEPDSTSEWSVFAPRLMMRLDNIKQTKVLQPGSRVSYRWAVTGDEVNLEKLRTFVTSQNVAGVKILSTTSLENTVTRANDYFNLSALVSMVLAGIACAISIKRYTERHYRYVALLRTFGMVQAQILRVYLFNVLGWGLLAALLGGVLGIFGQWILDYAVTQFITIPLPAISIIPILSAILLALVTLMGVGMPHLLQLKNVPTMKVLNDKIIPAQRSSILWYTLTFISVLLLSYITVHNLTVLGYFLASIIGMTFLLLLIGASILAFLRKIQSQLSSAWRFGIANVHRHRTNSLVLLVGFGLSIMVLLMMIQLQSGLILDWQYDLPKETPNYFAINIPTKNVAEMENFLKKNHIEIARFYPIVRGQLTTLNGKDIMSAIPASARNDNSLHRALNFTWLEQLPTHNKLYAGQWWTGSTAQHFVSVEREFAERLQLRIGDEVGITLENQLITARIMNIRQVNWVSFHPNFFMIYPPKMLEKFPATYMTSFYLSKQQSALLAQLVQNFPSVSIIDVAAITERIQFIINNVVMAILFILSFVFIASISVLIAGIQANITDRLQASMILRALGATQRQLTIIMLNEFLVIGAIAGLMAAIGAIIASNIIASHIFQMAASKTWQLLLFGPAIGILLVTSIGFISSRRILHQNAAQILRTFD